MTLQFQRRVANSQATAPWGRWKARRPAILPQRRGFPYSSRKVEERLADSGLTYGALGAFSGTSAAPPPQTWCGTQVDDYANWLGFYPRMGRRGAKPMEEKRKHRRIEINEPAYVSAEGVRR